MPRVRSFWGWGYEDKFPNDDARKALAERLAALFGTVPDLRDLPSPASLALREPRYTLPLELRSIATADVLERATHTYGRGYPDLVRGFGGDFSSAPDWVFHPTSEEQLTLLYRFCEKESIALVPYGGGTSVVGGTELAASGRFRGTACVDLSRMDAVLEVDAVSLAARIQAGASGARIAAQLAPYGVTLRHYPQSFELSTLGGWIATRASGHYATLFTHIDQFVESVRLVTPAGVFETRRLPSSGAGPDANGLVLGSEGAFGIITEAWVRVQPRPRWRASASVRFDAFDAGIMAARAISQSGLYPSNCRLLDAGEAMLHNVGNDGKAILLLAFESVDHPLEPWMERALSLATDVGGSYCEEPKYTTEVVFSMRPPASTRPPVSNRPKPVDVARDAEDATLWREAFFDAPYLQSALVSLGVVCDTFETACTWEAFPELHSAITSAVQKALGEACGGGVVTARLTHVYPDGPAPYYTFLGLAKAGRELDQWRIVKEAASEAIVKNGGTITHHHGVGRVHRPWWSKERSPLFEEALSAAKARFDPCGILNPGCLLPAK